MRGRVAAAILTGRCDCRLTQVNRGPSCSCIMRVSVLREVKFMSTRRGWYIVPTDRWYIERTVWLIAGCVLLASTLLAALVHPLWVLLVVVAAADSIVVSFTGFCVVGSTLARLGFRPALARPGWSPGHPYRMQTDAWYLERRIYLVVGINLTIASVLSLLHSPWWLLFTGFVGGAMVWFAATGFCIMANGLYRLGAEPRLAPGREARAAAAVSRHERPAT
jgi:hypothetical protein